jgi:hypothetical protein
MTKIIVTAQIVVLRRSKGKVNVHVDSDTNTESPMFMVKTSLFARVRPGFRVGLQGL